MSSTKNLSLSIGIPTYNQAEFLPETLDSILNQTHPPDEVVVSDHYSTDDTQEVLSCYGDRIKVVQPPPETNLTGQYNFTLSSLSGDWITLLSSDDVARPDFCATLLRGAASDPEAVLVRSGWEHIDAQGKSLGTHYMLSVPRCEAPPNTLVEQKHGPKVNFAAFAIQREAFQQSGPILPSLESLSDWALFLQLAPFGSFVYEHALLSGYRVGHDGNKFRDRLPQWTRDQVRVFAEVMPLAAKRCGMRELDWITDASVYNYTRYLARASREFSASEREPIVTLFRPWADSLHDPAAQTLLNEFADGAVTKTSIPLSRRVKTFLKPAFQSLHTLLRRR